LGAGGLAAGGFTAALSAADGIAACSPVLLATTSETLMPP
jgi:hypothetical protein